MVGNLKRFSMKKDKKNVSNKWVSYFPMIGQYSIVEYF